MDNRENKRERQKYNGIVEKGSSVPSTKNKLLSCDIQIYWSVHVSVPAFLRLAGSAQARAMFDRCAAVWEVEVIAIVVEWWRLVCTPAFKVAAKDVQTD